MNAPLPAVLLLDLDDTILAYDSVVEDCWSKVCTDFAPRIEYPLPALRDAIREYSRWYWSDPDRHRIGRLDLKAARRSIMGEIFRRLGIHDAGLAEEMADAYQQERNRAVHPIPGAIRTIERFLERGIRLALVTNGAEDAQAEKIERFGLARFFECILIEGAFGCGKPDERVYRHVLGELNARPEEAWMVGDNLEWDVAAPQRLGIFGVWVDYGARGLPPDSTFRPYRIIQSLPDLLAPFS